MIYKKAYRKRTYRKKSTGFKKAVTAIAKKAVNRQAETKTGTLSLGVAYGTAGYLYDLWGAVAQGIGQNNRIGDQVHALGMKIRGRINMDSATITANQDYNGVRMLIVAGKRPLTIGDFSTVSWNGPIDPELMTVLEDRVVQFQTTKRCVYFSKYVKLNRTFKYDANGSITNRPVYVYFCSVGGTGLLTNSGNNSDLTFQRYFKDI